MGSSVVLLVAAFVLTRVQAFVAADNYGVVWNGFGAIEGVLSRSTKAPMVYRVLLPWLLGASRWTRIPKLMLYELWRFVLMFAALLAVNRFWGLETTLILAMLLPVTFLFDYWDWSVELGCVALALSGNIYLALLAVILHALSRENWVLCALAFFVVSLDLHGTAIVGMTGLLVYIVVKTVQGKHEMYCSRFMLPDNLKLLRSLGLGNVPFYNGQWVTILVTLLAVPVVLYQLPGWPVYLALVVGGWLFGKINESRIMAAALPWCASLMWRLV